MHWFDDESIESQAASTLGEAHQEWDYGAYEGRLIRTWDTTAAIQAP
jgi:hypothetical protein